VEFINNSSKYIKLLNSTRFLEWFDYKVSNATYNLMQWFENFYSQKDKAHWTMEVMELWDKVAWHAKFCKKISKKKGVVGTMDEKMVQNFFSQIGSQGILWIPNTTTV
jgi:hypothetical protein